MKHKIIITGGHFTPAFAVIDELKETKDWEIYWVGISQAVSGEKVETLEKKVLPQLGIPFYAIDSIKFHRDSWTKSILGLSKLFTGIKQSFQILNSVKPDVILSFGSFISFPVAFVAWIKGIPIVIHEQTTSAGLANKIVSFLADKVAISFAETETDFPKEKVILTGNPVRRKVYEIAQLRETKKKNARPILYITGGSRGAQAINIAVLETIKDLVKVYDVIHLTGDLDYKKVKDTVAKLKISQSYKLYPTVPPQEVEKIYEVCDLAISRSGANTISELAILGIPALCIPLPNSAGQEQLKNAKLLEKEGAARILLQSDLSGQSLWEEIEVMRKNLPTYKNNAKRAKKLVPQDAASNIVSIVKNII